MYSVLKVAHELTVNTDTDLQTQRSEATRIFETKVFVRVKNEEYCRLERVNFTFTISTLLP
jgi:hypothetical protein